MANYKVTSNKISGHDAGSVLSDADLDGLNVAALIEAGHLTLVSAVRESKQDKPTSKTEQE